MVRYFSASTPNVVGGGMGPGGANGIPGETIGRLAGTATGTVAPCASAEGGGETSVATAVAASAVGGGVVNRVCL